MIEKINVTEDNHRLDQFLQKKLKITRNKVQALIKSNCVLVNNCNVKPAYKLQINDLIELTLPKDEKPKKEYSQKLEYLYEDNSIIVINKQPGLLVHETDNCTEATLVDYLKKESISLYPLSSNRAGIVHRLDKMTQGLMVIAKQKKSYEFLVEQFKKRAVKKRYFAMVKGNLSNNKLEINQPIDRDFKKRNKFVVAKTGKEAITKVTVLKRFNSKTLCDIELLTGRTHQIRVHMNFIGHPILGDSFYSRTSRNQGQLLQAYYLQFIHPESLKEISFCTQISDRILS